MAATQLRDHQLRYLSGTRTAEGKRVLHDQRDRYQDASHKQYDSYPIQNNAWSPAPAAGNNSSQEDVDSIVRSYLSHAEHICRPSRRLAPSQAQLLCPCCSDINRINSQKRVDTVVMPQTPVFKEKFPQATTSPEARAPLVSESLYLQNPEDADAAQGFLNYPSAASLWAYLRTADDHGLSPESCGQLTADVMQASTRYIEGMNKLDHLTQKNF